VRASTHLKDGTPIAITGAGGYFGGAGEVIVWNLPRDECSKRLPRPTRWAHFAAIPAGEPPLEPRLK
jgi:hypothetical protein